MANKKTADNVYSVYQPRKLKTPLVFDSPHSGRTYPDDFDFRCDFKDLRKSEDLLVDQLFAPLATKGYPFLKAHFPRSYIDVNRSCRRIDDQLVEANDDMPKLKKVEEINGTGLIRRFCSYTTQQPIYDRKLTLSEVFNRLSGYYYPYHNQLGKMLDRTHGEFGKYVYVSCHSLPSKFRDGNDNPYDVYLGTQDGDSCDPRILAALKEMFESKGYKVAENKFFKGGHNIKRYGAPDQGKHAILIEVNRGLYANEKNLSRNANFRNFQNDLMDIMQAFDKKAQDILFNNPGHRPKGHKFFR